MNYYDLDSLSRALGKLEERYRIPSGEFMDAHRADAASIQNIPGFVRHLWASLLLDVERMRGHSGQDSSLVEGVDHALALN